MKRIVVVLSLSMFLCSIALGQTKDTSSQKPISKPKKSVKAGNSETGSKHPCITWKQFKASGPSLKQLGWITVKHSKDIKSSPWSVGCETLDRDFAKFSVYKDKEGNSVVLAWYNDKVPSDDLKWDLVDLSIKNAKFRDPVYVEMITGKVYQLDQAAWKTEGENTTFTQLPVWDSPIMIAERSQVEVRNEFKD